jgi:hypothetical protein
MGGFGAGLKRFLLWDHSRGSWQYDVMVGLILAFIFLTPREFFRDQPRPRNIMMVSTGSGESSYFLEKHLLAEANPTDLLVRAEKLIRAQADGKNVTIERVEPVFGGDQELRGYFAHTH